MMPVRRPDESDALAAGTRARLAQAQREAAQLGVKSERITPHWRSFRGSEAGRELAERLRALFCGKCAYCEVQAARDVEHFYPKSLFPERMYRWDNLLFACKNCNTDKGDRFNFEGGRPLLLDPCDPAHDPADYFTWDLVTGRPRVTTDPARRPRADETLQVLGNLRDEGLAEARRALVRDFKFFLLLAGEETPTSAEAVSWLRELLAPQQPYRSVLRQLARDPALGPALAAARARSAQLGPLLDALLA